MSETSFNIKTSLGWEPQATAPSNPTEGDLYLDSTTSRIKEYRNGAWRPYGSAYDLEGSFTLTNNQTTAANVTGLLLSSATGAAAKIDYSIIRRHEVTDAFQTNATDSSKFGLQILDVNLQSDGSMFVGGNFIDYALTTGRNRLVKLNADGTVNTTWCAAFVDGAKLTGSVNTICPNPRTGKLVVAGATSYLGYTGSWQRLLRFNTDGSMDMPFMNNLVVGVKFSDQIWKVVLQPDNKLIIGGNFTNHAGVTGRSYLLRANDDGTVDTAFAANVDTYFNQNVQSIALQPDGKILVVGAFTNYQISGRHFLLRLNADGSLDTAFCANAVDGKIPITSAQAHNVFVQPDGKILVCGIWGNAYGVGGRQSLVRLNSDGTVDSAFCVNAVDSKFVGADIYSVYATASKVYVGGSILNYGRTSGRNHMLKFNMDGTLDTTFVTNASDSTKFGATGNFLTIRSIAVQPDNAVIIGGNYTDYATTSGRSRLLRLSPSGTLLQSSIFNENGTLNAAFDQYNQDWTISSPVGLGNAGINLSILTTGQIQYTSNNLSGSTVQSTMKHYVKYL